jgi:sirohydrochlorin cobaltochelatase
MALMSVAGEHAKKDMTGYQPDGWKSILTGQGFTCEAALKATTEIPEIADVCLDHLNTAFSPF